MSRDFFITSFYNDGRTEHDMSTGNVNEIVKYVKDHYSRKGGKGFLLSVQPESDDKIKSNLK